MHKKGNWTVTDTKIVYKNPWIAVREDKVIRPDNKSGIVGVVEMKHGVSVLPIDKAGNVYLTKEYHYAVERDTIEAISGGIEAGEDILAAAKRELEEEVGIVASEWLDLGKIDPFTTIINSPNYLFLARKLSFTKPHPEGTENIAVIKMPFTEALDMVMNNRITHGGSVTLILKAREFIK